MTDVSGDGVWSIVHTGERPPTSNWARGTTKHWSEQSRKTAEWRHAFWARARQIDLPHLPVVEFEAIPLHENLRSPQDTAACAPAVKAAIDGICCAMDGQPWDAKKVDDGPTRVIGVIYRPPACGVGIDGLQIVVRAMAPALRDVVAGTKMLMVPVGPAACNMLARQVGRVDPLAWGRAAGQLLDEAATSVMT